MLKKLSKTLRYCRNLALVCLLALLALLGVSPFYIYDRFNQETPIARLRFRQTGEDTYQAELRYGDFCRPRYYTVEGDQFQLDAGFIKWKGLGVLLGFAPRYRLDRLSGRYSDVDRQNERGTTAYDLAPDVLVDFFAANPQGDSNWLVDTRYGSSVYLAMNPDMGYTVYATEDGLITRATPLQEPRRQDGQLVITIDRACGGSPPLLETLSEKTNALAVSLLGADTGDDERH